MGFLKPPSYPYSLCQTLPDIAQEPAWVPLQVSPAGSPFLLALPGPLWWGEGKRALVGLKTPDASWSEENQRRLGTEKQG